VSRTQIKPTPATIIAVVALVAALAGTAWAAGLAKNSVRSKQIKDGQVLNQDLADGAVSSPKIEDGSLLKQDFAAGQIAAGEQGPQGIPGPPGPSTGPAGGDLAGSYPNPTIADGSVDGSDLDLATVPDVVSDAGTFPDDTLPHSLVALGNNAVSGSCNASGGTIALSYANATRLVQNVLISLRDAGDANPASTASQTVGPDDAVNVNQTTFTGPVEGSIWVSDAKQTMHVEVGIVHSTTCRYWAQATTDPN
jgi:hypothetical protein